jgi:hypothetical protein
VDEDHATTTSSPPLQLGINHRLPPDNSSALPPVHELFKRPSYFGHHPFSNPHSIHTTFRALFPFPYERLLLYWNIFIVYLFSIFVASMGIKPGKLCTLNLRANHYITAPAGCASSLPWSYTFTSSYVFMAWYLVMSKHNSPVQWVPGNLSLGEKRPGRETDHSPPPTVQVKSVRKAVIAQSVQRCATGWIIRVLGFDSRKGLEIFFTTAFRTALGPIQPPI